MQRLTVFLILFFCSLTPGRVQASIFGEETVVLTKMLANQLVELERLAESVGVAKERRDMLINAYRGIERVTQQIEAVQIIIQRAQGLDPSSIQRISDLTFLINEAKDLRRSTLDLLGVKLDIAEQAIAQGSLQADTTYKMGQEMVGLGAKLAQESRAASPGRASQISAAAASSQMIGQGVLLQNVAQQTQLLAMTLELQKSRIAREIAAEKAQGAAISEALGQAVPSRKSRHL